MRPWTAIRLALLLSTIVAAPTLAQERQQRYLDGLRRRQFYDLAEAYCRRELQREDLSATEQADLVIELSRTLAEHAEYLSDDRQAPMWDEAAAVVADYVVAQPEHPRRLLLEMQAALVEAARGESLRWRWSLNPVDEPLAEAARQRLRNAIEQLGELRGAVQESLRAAAPAPVAQQGGLAPHELRALLVHVEYRFGRALLNLAHTYEAGSPDRADAALRAQEALRRAVSLAPADQTGPDPNAASVSLVWDARLDDAEVSRLLGDRETALAQLDELGQLDPPPAVRDRAAAVRARVLLDERRLDEALALLGSHQETSSAAAGELAYLRVLALVETWHAALEAGRQEEADRIRHAIGQFVANTQEGPGGYWGRRAALAWERAVEDRELGGELADLIARAETLYLNGEIERALEAYARAAEQARNAGLAERAFDLAFTRGAILLDAGRFPAAADQFAELADQNPQHPRAAQSSFVAAYARGQAWLDQRSDQNMAAYRAALEQHLERFPADQTADDARWSLGRLHESQGRLPEAITAYRAIRPPNEHWADAQEAIGRAYQRLLEARRASGEPPGNLEAEATAYLESVIGNPAQDEATLARLSAATRLARIWIERDPPRYQAADDLLAAALAAAESSTPPEEEQAEWQRRLSAARQLRIAALAGLGRVQQAEDLLRALSDSDPGELLELLLGVLELAAESATDDPDREEIRRQLGDLALRTASRVLGRRHELSETQQADLDLALARAYTLSGQTDRAIELYAQLAAARADDPRVLGPYADVLLELGGDVYLRRAAELSRRLEALLPEGSPGWFRARYRLARSYFERGDHEQCARLIGLLRVVYPELGDPDQQAEFEALLQRCRQAMR